MVKWSSWPLAASVVLTMLAGCAGGDEAVTEESASSSQPSRLEVVQERGTLICGVSGVLPGFSFVDDEGNYAGMDVDMCRAIAAALFDDPNAVEFRNLNAQQRFTALQSGEIDVLSRNTTWTTSRDTSVGMEFAPVVFYDGQGMMVRTDSGIQTLEDLEGEAICVQSGTTTEQNLADRMSQRGITYESLVFEDADTTFATYAEGRCAAVTSDRSQLVSRRTTLPEPENNVILDEVLSKEPLAPAVTNGDSEWFDVVKWSIYATINAEELGVTSDNLDQQLNSENPEIARFLGQDGDLGEGLGLSNDFAARIVRHVGNYEEIYERNLGPDTPLNLPRGQNQIWEEGGLLYSPPFR